MSSLLRLLMLALALGCASSLRIAVAPTRSAAARSAAVRMALPKLDDARSLSADEIEQEIASAKKVRRRPTSLRAALPLAPPRPRVL